MGSCKIIFGPMFSGKSTKLRQEMTTLADVGAKVLYINHSKDSRNTESFDSNITTHHSGYKGLSNKIRPIKASKLSEIEINNYDAIGIDEGQFFDDLEVTVRDWVLNKNKHVIIASLDGNFLMGTFGQASRLISICDSGNIRN